MRSTISERNAGIPADLHVTEAAAHGGFFGLAPEDHDIERQIRIFVQDHWGRATSTNPS